MIKAVEDLGRAEIGPLPRNRRLVPLAAAAPPRIPQLIQLFHAISTLNAAHQPYVLQFVGSVQGEGVSTIASGFVQIAASQQGKPVLLIDCNAPAPQAVASPSLIDAFHETGAINAAIQPAPGRTGIGYARLSTAEDGRLNIDAGDLRKLFELAKKAFPIIVLDCPPACLTPESLALARFCDGTVLVIAAEAASRQTIAETKQALERFDGQIIGVVFNQYKTYIPRWLERWL